MLKGYAVNKKRLKVLNKTIEIQSRMLATAYELDEKELLDVIEAYHNALSLLDDYDHGSLSKPEGTDFIYRLTYEECQELIDKMKFESDVFGVEKKGSSTVSWLLSIKIYLGKSYIQVLKKRRLISYTSLSKIILLRTAVNASVLRSF